MNLFGFQNFQPMLFSTFYGLDVKTRSMPLATFFSSFFQIYNFDFSGSILFFG